MGQEVSLATATLQTNVLGDGGMGLFLFSYGMIPSLLTWLEDQVLPLWSSIIIWVEDKWNICTLGEMYILIVKQLENMYFSLNSFVTATKISKELHVPLLKGGANGEGTLKRITEVFTAIIIQVKMWTAFYDKTVRLCTFLGRLDHRREFNYLTSINLWKMHIHVQESGSKQIFIDGFGPDFVHSFSS